MDDSDESKCHAVYGIQFSDDKGWMSEEAREFVSQYFEDAAEFVEAPSAEDEDGIEPDYGKLTELGEAYVEKLYDSMKELTEKNELCRLAAREGRIMSERYKKRHGQEREARKAAIMDELLRGEKHDFYAGRIREGAEFDVTAGGAEYKFNPDGPYYPGGAWAWFRGAKSDYCYPHFDCRDIAKILGCGTSA